MTERVYNVLFICTGNSARSIFAESLVNLWGHGRFKGYSAGSYPKGSVHPYALDLLRSLDLPVAGLRSKSWNEFAQPGAPRMDFVFTVCDQAASEMCPVWSGQPMTAHWGVLDPTTADGSETVRRQAFHDAFRTLETRIRIFTSLQPEKLDRLSLKRRLDEIGCTEADQPGDPASVARGVKPDPAPLS